MNDDHVKEDNEIIDVKFSYSVRTEEQAKELVEAVHKAFRKLVSKWCNTKLTDDWGSIEIKRACIQCKQLYPEDKMDNERCMYCEKTNAETYDY